VQARLPRQKNAATAQVMRGSAQNAGFQIDILTRNSWRLEMSVTPHCKYAGGPLGKKIHTRSFVARLFERLRRRSIAGLRW
jgi:hypothetical protein